MSKERRQHERANLNRGDIPGAFYLEAEGQTHQFVQVNDVSISGMGISVPIALKPDTKVGLRYISDDFRIELESVVAWCEKPERGDLYRIGIRFLPSNMNENVLFFMTLREYVDDFGEAF